MAEETEFWCDPEKVIQGFDGIDNTILEIVKKGKTDFNSIDKYLIENLPPLHLTTWNKRDDNRKKECIAHIKQVYKDAKRYKTENKFEVDGDVKDNIKYTSFFETKDSLFEQYKDDKGIGFLKYDLELQTIEKISEYKDAITGITYKPCQGDEIEKEFIYLPSNIAEYGTDEELERDFPKSLFTEGGKL